MTSLRHSLNLHRGGVISIVGAGGKTALMFRLARELAGQGDRVLTTTTTKIRIPTRQQSAVVLLAEAAEPFLKNARTLLKRTPHLSAGRRVVPLQHKLIGFDPRTIDRIWRAGIFRWIIVEADGAAGKPLKAPAAHEPVIPECTQWTIGVVGLKAVGKPLSANWVFRPRLVSAITGLAPGATITASAISSVCLHANGIMKNAPAQAMRFVFLNQADSRQRLAAGKRIAKMLTARAKPGFTGVLIGQTLYEPTVEKYYITV